MFRHQILPDRGLVVLEFEGDVTAEELPRGFQSLVAQPNFSGSYPGVVDLRRARVPVDADEAGEFARYIAAQAASIAPWVYLVSPPTAPLSPSTPARSSRHSIRRRYSRP